MLIPRETQSHGTKFMRSRAPKVESMLTSTYVELLHIRNDVQQLTWTGFVCQTYVYQPRQSRYTRSLDFALPSHFQWLERLQLFRGLPPTSHAIKYRNTGPSGLLPKFGYCSEKGTLDKPISENHPLFQPMPLDDFQIHPPSNGLRGDKRPFQAHTHQPPGTGICRKHESGLCVSVAMCGLPRGGILFEQEKKSFQE